MGTETRLPTDDEINGIAWWNKKSEAQRTRLLKAARNFRGRDASAAECYRMYGRKYRATAEERREVLAMLGASAESRNG